jgi:hypothetical protein
MVMHKTQKSILLCRPQGGLTDLLAQIGKCCRYADTFDREVYVETDFHSTLYFRDDFSRYFISHDQNLVLSTATIASLFDHMEVFPTSLYGRINCYETGYNSQLGAVFETRSACITSFNFNVHYDAALLLHQSFGGGIYHAMIALRRLSISVEVREVIEQRLAQIGDTYTSIHIRHTDYSTDYRAHILDIAPEISGKIFVSTDNQEVLDFCRNVFGKERVWSFAKLPDQAGVPIHSNPVLDAHQSNIDAISDLLLLAMAKSYHFFRIQKKGSSTPPYSGFSMLANKLHKNPKLLQQFMRPEKFGAVSRWSLAVQKANSGLRGRAWRLVGRHF